MAKNYIYHHGIQGQKWGVRRYQNPDGSLTSAGRERYQRPNSDYRKPVEDTTLYKGYRLNSVSTTASKKIPKDRWAYTYDKNNKYDNLVYKGPFSLYKSKWGSRNVYEHQYVVKEDLKMPTKKERLDAFVNLYNDPKKHDLAAKELEHISKFLDNNKVPDVSGMRSKLNYSNLKTDKEYKAAYEVFNHMMENVAQFRTTAAYAKLMSSKYDAMVDDNNQGIYNYAKDPIIVFKANKVLKEVGNVTPVTLGQMTANMMELKDIYEKEGRAGERFKL